MLAKQYRLPRSIIFHNAKVFMTPYFKILIKENSLSYNRFGFVVSKKIDKRAVVRNRLRRILQSVAGQFLSPGSKDMLFIVKQPFIKEKTPDIALLIQSIMGKI